MKRKTLRKSFQYQQKKNKKIKEEEITIFSLNEDDLEKKIKQKENNQNQNNLVLSKLNNNNVIKTKENDIKKFTEGTSFEKIDYNEYNKALANFKSIFTKGIIKPIIKRQNIEPKYFRKSSEFLFDRSLYRGLEIELNLNENNFPILYKNNPSNGANRLKDKKYKISDFLNKISSFFNDNTKFIYYEYSNSKLLSFNKFSEGDLLSYRYFYKNFENNLLNREEHMKNLDYVNTLNDLFFKYNTEKKLFYIMTPLYTFSFNYKKEIPLLLTNSKTLEMELKEIGLNDKKNYSIDLIKKEGNKKRKNSNNNSNNIYEMEEENFENEDIKNFNNDHPLGIKELYVGHLFNYFINHNMQNPFNIFSNFQFEGASYKKCKTNIYNIPRNEKETNTNYTVNIRIEGIIFEEQLKDIINFFKKEFSTLNYTVKLNKVRTTNNFYFENKKLDNSFNRFEYKDNNYYFYKQ